MQQASSISSMQDLEQRSDAELENETRHRAAAQALLGARAAQRYDAPKAKEHFQRAIAAARPQERMQIRRMADASIALAERRPDALKAAVQKLGQEAPSNRQLFMLRVLGIVAPPKSAGTLARVRGILAVVLFVVAVLFLSFGIVSLIFLPFGQIGGQTRIFYAFLLVFIVLIVLFVLGRRRQKKALAGGGQPAKR
jgi:folylpolyglutamate synthase/dihydropteroate synthase